MSTQEKAAQPSHEAWMEFLMDHPTRGGIAEALVFQAGWQRCAEKAEAVNKELLEALRNAKIYFIGLAAYLATCNTDVIVENLETTIEALHNQERGIEAAIAKARGV